MLGFVIGHIRILGIGLELAYNRGSCGRRVISLKKVSLGSNCNSVWSQDDQFGP